jgi:hypothetical protein
MGYRETLILFHLITQRLGDSSFQTLVIQSTKTFSQHLNGYLRPLRHQTYWRERIITWK